MTLIDEAPAEPSTCSVPHGAADRPPTRTSPTPVAGSSHPAAPGGGRESSVDELAQIAPDADLAALLAALDITEVDDYGLVEVGAAFQRLAAWANAKLTEVAGELAWRPLLRNRGALPSAIDAGNMAADELAPRLGISRWAARRMVRNARGFASTFQETGEALVSGQIDIQKASTIVSMLEDYEPELAFLVQLEVLPDAGLQTHSQLVAAIRKAVIALGHDDADVRHAQARAKRRVDHPRQLPDGMASILAILPATDAVGLDLALETAARTARQNGDGRTLDQLRADALALMGHAALENGYVGLAPADHSGQATDETGPVEGDDPVDRAGPVGRSDPGDRPEPAERPDPVGRPDPADQPDPARWPTDGPPGTSQPDPATPDATTPPAPPSEADDRAAPDVTTTPSAPPSGADDGAARTSPRPDCAARHHTCCDGIGPCPVAPSRPPEPPQGTAVPSIGPLDRPSMQLGLIGGGRARINVTVPLSVLLPPDLARQLGLPARGAQAGNASDEPPPEPGSPPPPPGSPPLEPGTAPPEPGSPTPPPGTPPLPPTDRPGPRDEPPEPPASQADLVPLPAEDELLAFLEREPVEVAELEGYGPISPAVARAAALGGPWRRLVTDPLTGIVLDHGRARYRPPADLAELVRLRDGTCVRPGCSSPARVCELDHTTAWSAGGTTAMVNLGHLCVRDHLVKTDGAFAIRHLGAGDFEWITPTGHVYRRHRGGRVTFQGAVPERPPHIGPLPF